MENEVEQSFWKQHKWLLLAAAIVAVLIMIVNLAGFTTQTYSNTSSLNIRPGTTTEDSVGIAVPNEPEWPEKLNRELYDERLLRLVNYKKPAPVTEIVTAADGSTSTVSKITENLVYAEADNVTVKGDIWPARAPYPHGGAIIPERRILAYYGNFYSRYMGILGEYSEDEVIRRLLEEKAAWKQLTQTHQ